MCGRHSDHKTCVGRTGDRDMTVCDLGDVSVIVSVKADSPERLANLDRLHRFYCDLDPQAEVLIVTQSPIPVVPDRTGLRVHILEDEGLHWKTRNMNVGAALSERPFLLMSDADVIPHPKALAEAVSRLADGAGFVSLYNGIVVNVSQTGAGDPKDWTAFFAKLPHYRREDVVPGGPVEHPETRPLYGNAEHMAIGGCFLCSRTAFVEIGGWNTNFISYGFEDQELHYRAGVLGQPFGWIEDCNLVHFDHPRGAESRYGQFYRQNSAEYDRVRAMSSQELAAYAARGFRQMRFEDGFDYARFSSGDAEGWHRVSDARCDLSDLTILIHADPADVRPEASCLEALLDHLESTYRGYDLRVCENRTTAFKYPVNRHNVVFCPARDGPSAEEIAGILRQGGRSHLYTLRLEADAEGQLRRVSARLAKVKHGLPVRDVFPALNDALTHAD